MAAETRRAMLRVASGLPADHHARETIDSIAGDLTGAAFAIENGKKIDSIQRHMVERWQGAAHLINMDLNT
jgi:hypothetical protein